MRIENLGESRKIQALEKNSNQTMAGSPWHNLIEDILWNFEDVFDQAELILNWILNDYVDVILVSIISCLAAYILFATICAICSIIQEKINMPYYVRGIDIKNGQKIDKNSNERDAAIDPEDRRRQMALAAEKRVQNFKTRGMKNRQSKVVKI